MLQLQKKLDGKANISWIVDRDVWRRILKQPQPNAGCRATEKEEEEKKEAREDQKDGGRTNALCGY
jgi:hypothetical protein